MPTTRPHEHHWSPHLLLFHLLQNTTSADGSADEFQEYYYYEEEAWNKRREDIQKLVKIVVIIFDCGVGLGVILSLIGICLLLSMTSEEVRRRSVMWYFCHLTVVTCFTAFSLHLVARAGHYRTSYTSCLYMVYGAEYAFFMSGFNILLINVEAICTIIFPNRRWEEHKMLRFCLSILGTWIFVCLLVAHIVVENNAAVDKRYHCFILRDKSIMKIRLAFRDYFPCCAVFLCTVAAVALYYMQRSRAVMTTDLRVPDSAPAEWLRCIVVMNIFYMIRVGGIPILHLVIPRKMQYYIVYSVIYLFHTTSFYLLPLPLFFIADVRMAISDVFRKIGQRLCLRNNEIHKDIQPLSLSGVMHTSQD